MPQSFPWCTHFELRKAYFRLKHPARLETLPDGTGMYRVHIGAHFLDLHWLEVDALFRQVSRTEAEATARIIKEDFA